MTDDDEPTERYFAFGANMARRVLVNRRGIVPRQSVAGRLDGYALRFGLRGVPLVEPAFATLVEAPGESMYGVLHTLRARDLARLDRIEGGYDRIAVTVQTDEGPVRASAYRARRLAAEREPSRRYLRLLLEGAREHGLPEEWIAALEARRGRHVPGLAVVVESVVEHGERALRALRRGRGD